MPWLWRIIAALIAFLLASATAFAERLIGEAAARIWRLVAEGLVLVAVLMGLVLLTSGLIALAESLRKDAPGR
jgi:hypothetical protein